MNDDDIRPPARQPADDATPAPTRAPARISAATFDAVRAVQRYHADRPPSAPSPAEPLLP